MELSVKKSIKITTASQFQTLVNCMEELPHLAMGTPQFGSSKAAMEQAWETVAKKVNAYGPPVRSGSEWKKVWADIKSRLKKKIADNNKSLRETGGGPCRVSNLTGLELDIDRICHISTAAAPDGNVFGFHQKLASDITPPRASKSVAVVTPTSATAKFKDTYAQQWVVCEDKSVSPPTSSKYVSEPYRMTKPIASTPKQKPVSPPTSSKYVSEPYRMTKPIASTPKQKPVQIVSSQRKRKLCESEQRNPERIKLLRQQASIQAETLKAIQSQAEATKDCTKILKECAEAIKEQSASLKIMSESMRLMTKAMFDVVKHFTEEQT